MLEINSLHAHYNEAIELVKERKVEYSVTDMEGDFTTLPMHLTPNKFSCRTTHGTAVIAATGFLKDSNKRDFKNTTMVINGAGHVEIMLLSILDLKVYLENVSGGYG